MKGNWIPITQNYELTECAIVTVRSKNPIAMGLPGWGLQNNTLAYMPLPPDINTCPEIWKSEYRGDELPKKSDNYIVQLQGKNNRLKVTILFFSTKLYKWLAVPEGWEVIGWMNCPRPYKKAI